MADLTHPKVYFHLYYCPDIKCLKAKNPVPGSMHQRGIHSTSIDPHDDVTCPGCGGVMKIARNGHVNGVPHPDGHITTDRDGNGLMNGDAIIHEAPGQEADSDTVRRQRLGVA